MKNRESGLPFDDFRALLLQLPEPDENAWQLTKSQISERLGKNPGMFSEICEWYAKWSGRSPALSRPVLTRFAGTHAVDSSVDEILLQEVAAISSGTSATNRICHQHDIGLKVLDLALQIPVADITNQAALDEKSCAGTIAFGMEAIAGGTDLLCATAIEKDLNVSCLAILAVLWNLKPETATKDARLAELAEDAVHLVSGQSAQKVDGLEVLRKLGGRETSAICGAILAARSQHIPVLLAGPTAITSAAILEYIQPGAIDHCLLAQSSGNRAVEEIVVKIGMKTVLREFYSDDPGVQAGLAAGMVRSACLAFSKGE